MTNEQAIRRLEDLQRLYLGNEKFTADIEAIEKAIEALKKQPCEDAISRQEALSHQHIVYDDDGIGYIVVNVDEIMALSSVTPKADKEKES